MRFQLEFTEDPQEFLLRAGGLLEADPVLGTVVASVTARAIAAVEAGEPAPRHPQWWLSVADEATGEVVGVVMRTAPFLPHPLYVLPLPDAAARQVAAALVDRGEEVAGINGALPAAEVMATELARRTGRRARVHEHTRLHVLERLVEPKVAPDGRPRVAVPADAELALAWFRAFHADAAAQAGRLGSEQEGEQFDEADIAARIAEGRIWLWEDALGTPVSLVGLQRAELRRRPGRARSTRPAHTAGTGTPACSPRTSRGCCATRATGSACSPTRRTRPRTRSTPRSATCRSSTWPTW